MNVSLTIDYITIMLGILLFIYSAGKTRGDLPIYDVYQAMIITVLSCAIVDIGLQMSIIYGHSDFLSNLLLAFVSVLVITCCLLFSIYILYMAEVDFRYEPVWGLLIFTPYLITLLYIIFNIWNHSMYYIQGGVLKYSNGYGIPYIYVAFNCLIWFLIRQYYRKTISKEQRLYILNFIILYLLIGVAQRITGIYSIYSLGHVLCLLIVIYAVQNPDRAFDQTNAMYKKYLFESAFRDLSRGKKFSIVFLRVHDVDLMQESYGDEETNSILRQIVTYIKEDIKKSVIYRVDNNTYAIRIYLTDNVAVNAVRKKIIARFAENVRTGINSIKINVGIVTAQFPEDAYDINGFKNLINSVSRSIISVEEDVTIKEFLEEDNEREIIDAIKKALNNNTFRVFYQPIFSTEKKKIIAAEALIRLFDDKLGFISPEIFIPIAEREGFILKIGKFVFTEVCRYFSENKLDKKGIEYIEVNLSAIQCMQYKLAEEFMDIMREHGIKPEQINFEITESSAMINNNAVSLNIDYFVKHGTEISLDDYGTGYSNISYLYNLPFAIMKVDKGILWSADKNEKADITLQNIFSMAKELKMKIVVEGVETEEQIKKLIKLKCDYFQGFYFSKPVNENDFLVYLENFTTPKVCLN